MRDRDQQEQLIASFERALRTHVFEKRLSDSERERALQGALDAFASAPRAPLPAYDRASRIYRHWPQLAAAVSLMLAGAGAFSLLSHGGNAGAESRSGDVAPSSTPRAASAPASVTVRPTFTEPLRSAAVETTPEPNGARIALAKGAEQLLGSATFRALEQSVVSIERAADTGIEGVRLEYGRLLVEAAPSAGTPFRVVTQAFGVDGAGTRFTISPSSVQVQEGTVRVLDASGRTIVAALTTGRSWEANVALRSTESARGAAGAARPAKDAVGRSAEPSASSLLTEARTRIANRDTVFARELIARARTRTMQPREKAEAETLLAECALVEGRRGVAISSYERVAEQQSDPVAAENALFAAARIASESGDRAGARRLLLRYLERYPSGRFQAQARARLKELRE